MRKSYENFNEGVYETITGHNNMLKKTFYYSEQEVKELCKLASNGNFPSDTFEIWWNNVKKK